jgi:hypothetical protein
MHDIQQALRRKKLSVNIVRVIRNPCRSTIPYRCAKANPTAHSLEMSRLITGGQGWGRIRPIRIRIGIREYSSNSNFENDLKIRRIRIPKQKFEFAIANSNSNRILLPKFANIHQKIEFAL